MHVVSFETAKRLKDAGFPQPETVCYGQSMYTYQGHLFFEPDTKESFSVYTNAVFAPTATDILKELGVPFGVRNELGTWVCFEMEGIGIGSVVLWEIHELEAHKNPAEACAAAWMAKNADKGFEKADPLENENEF